MEPNIAYIKELMKKRNLSLRGLALKAGVSAGALSNFFKGKRGAGKSIINGFIKAFPDEPLEKLFFLPNASSNINEQ